MKEKGLLKLVISVGLAVVLLASILLAACAPEAAPAPGAPTRITPQVPAAPTPAAPTPTTPTLPPSPSATVFDWKLQCHVNPGTPDYDIQAVKFAEKVETLSGGRIKLTLYGSGMLCPPSEIFRACAAGLFEIGVSDVGYHAGFMPELAAPQSPFLLRGLSDAMVVWYFSGYQEFVRKSYDENGVHLIVINAGTDSPLFSSKPIRRAADFEGMKIRVPGARAMFFDALGARTTYIPAGEVYLALSTGTIDAATYGNEASVIPMGWYDVCKYIIYPVTVGETLGNDVYANPKAFNSLSPDLQNVLDQCGRLQLPEYTVTGKWNDLQVFEEVNEKGVTRLHIPTEDYPILTKAAEGVWADLASKSPEAKITMKILTDYARARGYTDFKIE